MSSGFARATEECAQHPTADEESETKGQLSFGSYPKGSRLPNQAIEEFLLCPRDPTLGPHLDPPMYFY